MYPWIRERRKVENNADVFITSLKKLVADQVWLTVGVAEYKLVDAAKGDCDLQDAPKTIHASKCSKKSAIKHSPNPFRFFRLA